MVVWHQVVATHNTHNTHTHTTGASSYNGMCMHQTTNTFTRVDAGTREGKIFVILNKAKRVL